MLIKNKKILSRIPFPSQSPISLISVDQTDSLLCIAKNEKNAYTECFVIKQDAVQKEKSAIRRQYKLWFDRKADTNDDDMTNIFQCIHSQKIKTSRDVTCNFFGFDQKRLVLTTYNNESDCIDLIDSNYIEADFEYFDFRRFLLFKTPKFFEKALESLKHSYLVRLQSFVFLSAVCLERMRICAMQN